ncbi:MAG: hypothetical protein K0R38_4802 [Polyangiaceae bacterium]|nr:hypothetical protein [Polyangiaceae bacterium]
MRAPWLRVGLLALWLLRRVLVNSSEPGESQDVGEYLLYDLRLDRGAELTRLRLAPVTSPLDATITSDLGCKE